MSQKCLRSAGSAGYREGEGEERTRKGRRGKAGERGVKGRCSPV